MASTEPRAPRRTPRPCTVLVALVATLAAPAIDAAEPFPSRPVRLVLSFGAPGGAPDIIARIISPKLTDMWGRQVVVDPRSGAGGVVGTEIVAKAPPDGYSLVIVSPAHAINPSLDRRLPYDSVKDFAPVTKLTDVPNILTIYPPLGPRNVQDLIALAKAKPGILQYGSAGVGSSQHLAGALFCRMTGVNMIHIPYKGGAAVAIDLVAGRVQLTFGANTSLPHIRAGRLIGLGVTTARRSPALPDIPTIAEQGVPGYEAPAWYGLLAPAGTPPAIITKLHRDFKTVMELPDVREALSAQIIESVPSASPRAFADYLAAETRKWSVLVKESGAKAD